MAERTPKESIIKYLQDAIAAETSFETQLRSMAKQGDDEVVQNLFYQHAEETAEQIRLLTNRLEELGGSKSTMKSLLAHMFGSVPKGAQIGQETEDLNTQNLIVAFSVEHSEIAMYEALRAAAEAAGDTQTVALAEQIQEEERRTAEKIWSQLSTSAAASMERLSVKSGEGIYGSATA